MVDATGNIILGSLSLNPANLSPTTIPVAVTANGNSCGNDGFVASGQAIPQMAAFYFASGTSSLNYGEYLSPWASTGNAAGSVTLSATLSNLEVDGILDNGNGNVTIAVSQQGGNGTKTCYFVTTAEANFATGMFGTNLLDSSPHRDNIVVDSLGFSKGGILAYDAGASSFVKIDPVTGNNQSSFFSGTDPTEAHFGYDPSGGSFYTFDVNSRVLIKYTAWW